MFLAKYSPLIGFMISLAIFNVPLTYYHSFLSSIQYGGEQHTKRIILCTNLMIFFFENERTLVLTDRSELLDDPSYRGYWVVKELQRLLGV